MIKILRRIRVTLWLNREYYMGVRWCGISLRVFNSISSEWTQWKSEISRWTKEKKRNSISTSNHVLFCLWNKLYRPLLTRIGYFADEWRVANTSPYILQPERVIDGKESESFTPMISVVILITVFCTILMMSVRRIWYWINYNYSPDWGFWMNEWKLY